MKSCKNTIHSDVQTEINFYSTPVAFVVKKAVTSFILCTSFFLLGSLFSLNAHGATFNVTNTNDAGGGSLRQAVTNANQFADTDIINFTLSGCPCTITLTDEIFIIGPVTINGPGANLLIIDGGIGSNRIFDINTGSTITIKDMTLQSGNFFLQGGAIYAISATVILDSIVVRDSSSDDQGGALALVQGNFTLRNSAIYNNSAGRCGGVVNSNGILAVTNTTISGNSGAYGGGFCNYGDARTTFRNSTITNNTATGTGGGGGIHNWGDPLFGNLVNLGSTIVGGNFSPNASRPDMWFELGNMQTAGYNLIGKNDGANTIFPAGNPNGNNDIVGTIVSPIVPGLAALINNGGATPTHALTGGSPAIDKGFAFSLTTDQRGTGFLRTFNDPSISPASGGDNTDIGAFEVQSGIPISPPTINAQSGVTRQQGSPVSNSQIATVSDDSGAGSVTVAVTSANPSNGVTLSTIVNTGGNVTANIIASCSATNTSFTLQASDGSQTANATLSVTVTGNTAPTLTYTSPQSVGFNGSLNVTPTAASDNGTVTYSILSGHGLTTAPTVNSAGVVSITNAQPAGAHAVTVRAMDTCNVITDTSFTLNVSAPPPTLGNYSNASIPLSGNTSIISSGEPANVTSMNVSASTGFKGKLEGNPATGVVRVTDAHPAGTYPITVTAFNSTGGTIIKTFNLTVTTPAACAALNFNSSSVGTATSFGPDSVVVGDFDGDGNQDLATGNRGGGNITVMKGDGAGGFSEFGGSPVTMPSGVVFIAVGDYDGDGKQDLAAVNGNSTVSILKGDGSGGFSQIGPNISVGSGASSLTVGDFNGDGKQDLAVANTVSNNVTILRGDGSGGFTQFSGSPIGVGTNPNSVTIGDFDEDNKQDLAVANLNSPNITVLKGDGSGGFTNFAGSPVSMANSQFYITTGDFDGDDNQDLISVSTSNNASVLKGNGSGGFSLFSGSPFGVSSSPRAVVVGDLDGDGKHDLATVNQFSTDVTVFKGDGLGGFAPYGSPFPVGNTPNSIAIGDFNEDGKQDLAAANQGSNNITVLLRSCNTALPDITSIFNPTQQQGSPALNSLIATVSDADNAEDTLIVSINGMSASGANTVTSGGVTISNLSIDSSGNINADIVAACDATIPTVNFTLRVTDSGALFDEETFTVTVTANTPPTLTYPGPQTVSFDGSLNVSPTDATENGMVTFEILPGHGLTTSPMVDEDGTVIITNAQPAGVHTITVRATDNCGEFTDASFTLTVGCPTITVEPESISNATYGTPYNQMFTASGGTGSYSFSYTGTLPNGLMLDSNGNLTGSPTEVGDFNFTVIAADTGGASKKKPSSKISSVEAIGCNGSRSYTLSVAKADTTTAITNEIALATPTVVGEQITIEWSVMPAGEANGTPTGTVTITINGIDECLNVPLPTTQCNFTPMASGSLDIVATYSGDDNFNTSMSSNVGHLINNADTTTTITNAAGLSSTPTSIGESYMVQWSVTVNSPGSDTPTGYVRVSEGVEECVAPIEDGQCTLTSLSGGMKTITAQYEGDGNFNGSTSVGVPHTVTCATDPVVMNSNDDGEGSLRQAILTACVGSTITFAESVTGSINLTSGELDIEKDLTIQGPGADKLTVRVDSESSSGIGGDFRVFFIGSGEFRQEAGRCGRRTQKRTEGETYPPVVTISGLTIADGFSVFCDGGGIQNFGVLTLRDSFVVGNGAEVFGGGIYNDGELTVVNSTIAYNGAFVSGGGIFNTEFGFLTVINSTISNNITLGSDGGGVTTDGFMHVTNATVTGNAHILFEGGGGSARRARTEGPLALGGGGISAFGLEILDNTIVAGNCQIAVTIEPSKRTLLKRMGTEGIGAPSPSPCVEPPVVNGSGPTVTTTANDIQGDEIFCEPCDGGKGGEIINSAHNNLIGDANTSGSIQNGVDNNIVGNNGVGTIDINTILDTKLDVYGGKTPTHHLVPKSPAIDAGDDERALDENEDPLTTDQRGATYARKRNGNYDALNSVDIGSFEHARKVPVDFDGDGRSDFAVVEIPLSARDAEGRSVKPIGGDILANERRRIWSYDYQKLLNFRSGRGFVELPKDVQAMLERINQNGDAPGQPSTEGADLMWMIRRSGNGETLTYNLGTTDAVFVPADYDGDGESDAAIWTTSSACKTEGSCAVNGVPTHQFIVINSFDGSVHTYDLGTSMSDPTVVGDYDGDGRDDPAVYDSATGLWSWLGGASHNTLETQIWMPGGVPTPGDYNGDGKNDFAVQVPPVAASDAAKFRIAYNDGDVGPASDLPLTYGLSIYQTIPGDYDDDGITDIAQANLSGTAIIWRVLRSSSNYTLQTKITFGTVATDFTVQGDYDGDGKLDRAVYRATGSPEDGVFRVLQSSNNITVTFDWGGEFDNPVAFFNTH